MQQVTTASTQAAAEMALLNTLVLIRNGKEMTKFKEIERCHLKWCYCRRPFKTVHAASKINKRSKKGKRYKNGSANKGKRSLELVCTVVLLPLSLFLLLFVPLCLPQFAGSCSLLALAPHLHTFSLSPPPSSFTSLHLFCCFIIKYSALTNCQRSSSTASAESCLTVGSPVSFSLFSHISLRFKVSLSLFLFLPVFVSSLSFLSWDWVWKMSMSKNRQAKVIERTLLCTALSTSSNTTPETALNSCFSSLFCCCWSIFFLLSLSTN